MDFTTDAMPACPQMVDIIPEENGHIHHLPQEKKEIPQDAQRLFEYMVLFWDGRRSSIYRRFGLTKKALKGSISSLQSAGLIETEAYRSFGIFKNERIHIPRTASANEALKASVPTFINNGCSMLVKTEMDSLLSLVKSHGPLNLRELAPLFKCEARDLLWLAQKLSELGIASVRHNGQNTLIQTASIDLLPKPSLPEGRIFTTYPLSRDGTSLPVNIWVHRGTYTYRLGHPLFTKETSAIIDSLYGAAIPDTSSLADWDSLRKSLSDAIEQNLASKLPILSKKTKAYVLSHLTDRMQLGLLENLLADERVQEIKAQGDSPVYIKHSGVAADWLPTNITVSETSLQRYAHSIASSADLQIDAGNPLMDAVLHTNDRVNVCLPKTSGGRTVIEIRKFARRPFDFAQLVRLGTITPEAMALLWLCIQHRMNILVAGETGCGKTSFVNALSLFIPRDDHIVSVEDTREIRLPKAFGNATHLTTCNGAGDSPITMDRLLLNALRMDPSFIIMGEVRSPADIETLMGATAMGHPVLSTIHARDCETTVKRFADAGVPASEMAGIHLNVVLEAIRSKGAKMVKEIAEYTVTGGQASPKRLYRLDMSQHELKPVDEPQALTRQVMERTGMSRQEMDKDLSRRTTIISWLAQNNVEDTDLLCETVQRYYRCPEKVAEMFI